MSDTVSTITNLIDEQIARRPDATAVIYGERHISYTELSDLGARTAAGLASLGVGIGDRVGLWLPNTPAYLGLLLGCARLGAIATSVNTRFRSTEVADIVIRSGATTRLR